MHIPFVTGQFFWNSVDLSAHVTGGDLEMRKDQVEDGPCMGQLVRKMLPVISDWTLRIRFKQDFGAALVNATLRADSDGGVERAWRFRATNAAISATNPEFQGTGLIESYAPIRGDHGEVLGTEIVVRPGSTGTAIVEDTTP